MDLFIFLKFYTLSTVLGARMAKDTKKYENNFTVEQVSNNIRKLKILYNTLADM